MTLECNFYTVFLENIFVEIYLIKCIREMYMREQYISIPREIDGANISAFSLYSWDISESVL